MASMNELLGLKYGLAAVQMPPEVVNPTLVFKNQEPGSRTTVEAAKLLAFDFALFVRHRLAANVGDPRLSVVESNIHWSIPGGLLGTKKQLVCGLVVGRWEDRAIEVVTPFDSLSLYPRSPFDQEPFGTNRVIDLFEEYADLFRELNRVHGRIGLPYPK